MATKAKSSGMTKADVIKEAKKLKIRTVRLKFTDTLGACKNVEIPGGLLEQALNDGVFFDGSSIEGFVRIQESDMMLMPDASTFSVVPWSSDRHREARLICDVVNVDGSPFAGCPRGFLRRMVDKAADMGYEMMAGPEAEFFLFERDEIGEPTLMVHDRAGYFDMSPTDKGEFCRRDIMVALDEMGFLVEASHHEVAYGQHEIDFRYDDALKTADNVQTFRLVVKAIALIHGLHATFMPKPVYGINGSGMHCHQSLFSKGKNAFFDKKDKQGLSKTARYYVGGLLKHARAFTAITNPLVNSYKRLVPGYEAPVFCTWAEKNRTPMIRVPATRGQGTRLEVRSPDPSCNPYLALGLMLRAGLDGIENKIDPGDSVNRNLYEMTTEERERLEIPVLPGSLEEALNELEDNQLMRDALGPHLFDSFMAAKRHEWSEYRERVHSWEIDTYLTQY